MSAPIILSFSGGKDSVLAAARLRESGWDIRAAWASFTDDGALAMHRASEALIAQQAASIGLPLARFTMPRDAPNAVYEERLAAALDPFRAQGVRHVAFGDLFLTDIKAYRDALMARLGFEPVYPLWGENTRALAAAFVRGGYRAVAICVDASKLGIEWAGREMDAAFFADLPAGVDPCGENGEFHSFVYDGPGFFYPVRFERAALTNAGGFHCCALHPLPAESCARCGVTFECGMKAGSRHCWCERMPKITPDAAATSCLCPRCLQALAERG